MYFHQILDVHIYIYERVRSNCHQGASSLPTLLIFGLSYVNFTHPRWTVVLTLNSPSYVTTPLSAI